MSDPDRNLDLTWNVTSYDGKELRINVKFDEALQISTGLYADHIIFEVNDTLQKVFEARNQAMILITKRDLLPLPKQMIPSAKAEMMQTAAESSAWVIGGSMMASLSISFLFKIPITQLIQMIGTI